MANFQNKIPRNLGNWREKLNYVVSGLLDQSTREPSLTYLYRGHYATGVSTRPVLGGVRTISSSLLSPPPNL